MARQAHQFAATGNRSLQVQIDSVLRTVTGKPYFSPILKQQGGTNGIAFSPDGTLLASSDTEPHVISLWDLTQPGTKPITLPGYPAHQMIPGTTTPAGFVFALAFSPDGETLIAASSDGSVGKWDLAHPQTPFTELNRQESGVWSAAYSADGRWLVLGSKRDDAFAIWDLNQAEAGPIVVSDLQPAATGSGPGLIKDGGVPVAFSPDGTTLATGSLNGAIRIWRSGEFIRPVTSLRGHENGLLALAYSNDGKYLASSGQDATVRLWHLDAPSTDPVLLENGSTPINSLDFDADGHILAGSSNGAGIKLWQVDKPDTAPVVIADGEYWRVAFSSDGKRLASAGLAPYFLRLWNMEPSGRPLILAGHQDVVVTLAFNPDMTLLASGGSTGDQTIRLWRWDELDATPAVIRSQAGPINSLQFSADGKHLLSVSWKDNSIRLWKLGDSSLPFIDYPVPQAFNSWTALFSPDGKTIAAVGKGGARSWNTADPNAESKLILPSKEFATGIAFSPNGKLLAMASWAPAVYLKDLTRPDEAAIELLGHEGSNAAWSVAFSPDGSLLASGGKNDATVRLWDPNAPEVPSIVLGRHDADVIRVRFSPDGKQLASVSLDHSVRLWNIEQPEALPIVLSGHEGPVWSLTYSPDGNYLVTGGSETIRVWDLTHPLNTSTTKELANQVCEKVWRNLTLDEWHKYVGVEIPYERTCSNLPIHPSLFAAAEKQAKLGNKKSAIALLERALELDSSLGLEPLQEVNRWLKSASNESKN